jgi:hypothetical protein
MEFTLGHDFISRLLVNSLSLIILIRFCYYRFSQHKTNASSFILFGMGVFLVTSLLHSAQVSMGFAFGLFAVFSMLRYRTESISIKEMTYLFLVISIALLSAVSKLSVIELSCITLTVCLITYLLETSVLIPALDELEIDYEKIEFIKSHQKHNLIQDLNTRTGLNIQQVEILYIDFLRDCARLKIRYKGRDGQSSVQQNNSVPTSEQNA